uniref:sensor histidine kinase n=1 Tax=Ningiella ruwaisensis TaxID=2364274 RepID=UPI00109FE2A1|nr:histidine kinase [Ningiella ruwaisensis]
MQSSYFHYYQCVAWLAVFIVITTTIHLSRGLTEYELYFAAALIGSTALYSYFIRYLFLRFMSHRAVLLQVVYFIFQSILGAAFGSFMLILCILAFSYFQLIPHIPSDSVMFAVNTLFWGNWYNMFSALVLWSSAYLVLIKARQLYAAKEALASSRLEALSQQLNPHFLFNTLNNIRARILEEPQKARDSLAQLADMLRYTLEQHKDSKVILKKELAVVEQFIALCKIQFEERLNFEAQVDKRAENALIPRMVLQLCVENAIKHGISKLKKGGKVALTVGIEADNALSVQITNPVNEAISAKPDRQNDNASEYLNAGVGLKNIRQRLTLLYPENSEVKPFFALNIADNLATTRMKIPLQYLESETESQVKEKGLV